jgi:hypothetical protein
MGDNPGREEYQTASQNGSRSVLVHKRYHTKVDIDQLPPAAFDEWWPRVKIAELPTQ